MEMLRRRLQGTHFSRPMAVSWVSLFFPSFLLPTDPAPHHFPPPPSISSPWLPHPRRLPSPLPPPSLSRPPAPHFTRRHENQIVSSPFFFFPHPDPLSLRGPSSELPPASPPSSTPPFPPSTSSSPPPTRSDAWVPRCWGRGSSENWEPQGLFWGGCRQGGSTSPPQCIGELTYR